VRDAVSDADDFDVSDLLLTVFGVYVYHQLFKTLLCVYCDGRQPLLAVV